MLEMRFGKELDYYGKPKMTYNEMAAVLDLKPGHVEYAIKYQCKKIGKLKT